MSTLDSPLWPPPLRRHAQNRVNRDKLNKPTGLNATCAMTSPSRIAYQLLLRFARSYTCIATHTHTFGCRESLKCFKSPTTSTQMFACLYMDNYIQTTENLECSSFHLLAKITSRWKTCQEQISLPCFSNELLDGRDSGHPKTKQQGNNYTAIVHNLSCPYLSLESRIFTASTSPSLALRDKLIKTKRLNECLGVISTRFATFAQQKSVRLR